MQAKRFVIINGDDFGFSRGVNQAIIKAHKTGVLTSTSLMVTGDAAQEAVALAKAHPDLGVGLHLVVCCGKSVLPPSQIPHLVDASGYFPNSAVQAGLRYQFNLAARQELRLEIRAQLEKFHSTGLVLSHVDGHLHLHTHPVVLRLLVEFASEFKIRVIRLPHEELSTTLNIDRRNLVTKLIWSLIFRQLRHYGENLLTPQGIRTVERVYGLLQTGGITEEYLLKLLPQISANMIEIYSHPALPSLGEPINTAITAGTLELEALVSERVRNLLNEYNFELTNYHALWVQGDR